MWLIQNLSKIGWRQKKAYILICYEHDVAGEILGVYTNKRVAEALACNYCVVKTTTLVINK